MNPIPNRILKMVLSVVNNYSAKGKVIPKANSVPEFPGCP